MTVRFLDGGKTYGGVSDYSDVENSLVLKIDLRDCAHSHEVLNKAFYSFCSNWSIFKARENFSLHLFEDPVVEYFVERLRSNKDLKIIQIIMLTSVASLEADFKLAPTLIIGWNMIERALFDYYNDANIKYINFNADIYYNVYDLNG